MKKDEKKKKTLEFGIRIGFGVGIGAFSYWSYVIIYYNFSWFFVHTQQHGTGIRLAKFVILFIKQWLFSNNYIKTIIIGLKFCFLNYHSVGLCFRLITIDILFKLPLIFVFIFSLFCFVHVGPFVIESFSYRNKSKIFATF